MSRSRARKSRPLPGAAIASQALKPLSTVQAPAPVDEPAESFFTNCHAVLVQGKATRRHLFFSLPAAERCVVRANARGDVAAMVLVQLVPVQHLEIRGGDDD